MYAIFMACMLLVGCSSPPSVTPLLRVTERALVEESGRLKEDAERDRLYTRQILGSLDDAYRRDLEQAEVLTSGWVREATTVYVAARDAVIQHEQTLAEERGNRADNLLAAATATRRAILLIEQQDGLLRGVAGEELSQLLYGLTNAGQEYMHE
ncbi:MAG: hypothetical protein R3C45_19965 [Phycisphaerales bacterium]